MLAYTILAALVVALGFTLGYYAATIAAASALTIARRREGWAREDADAATEALVAAEARIRDHAATEAALAQVQRDAERAEARAAEAEAGRASLSALVAIWERHRDDAEAERDEARAALAEAEARAEAAERDASACRVNLAFAVMDARAGVHQGTAGDGGLQG